MKMYNFETYKTILLETAMFHLNCAKCSLQTFQLNMNVDIEKYKGLALLLHDIKFSVRADSCRANSETHAARWAQVQQEIDAGGSYRLTETELVYGAKLAWRNSARCIGRIQWSKLQVCIQIF